MLIVFDLVLYSPQMLNIINWYTLTDESTNGMHLLYRVFMTKISEFIKFIIQKDKCSFQYGDDVSVSE